MCDPKEIFVTTSIIDEKSMDKDKKNIVGTIGEALDFIHSPPIPDKECLLCNLPDDVPILYKGAHSQLIQCPMCDRMIVHLLDHRPTWTYCEMNEVLVLSKKGQCKSPHKIHLDFYAEFPGHFSVHITDKKRYVATIDLSEFWKIYIALYKFVYSYLKIAQPDALYKNRIIEKKARGVPIYELFKQLTENVRLGFEGEKLFHKLSMFYQALDQKE